MIDAMLSPSGVTVHYPALYDVAGTPALPAGLGYRLTESNSFSGGVPGGSNSFATALFALDYLHWWAAHGCAGINFHTTQWRFNGTIHLDTSGACQVYPMAYGIKAFSLGGHGRVMGVSVANPDSLNLTAYAVMDADTLYVTVINKEHGGHARDGLILIRADGASAPGAAMFLTAPGDNPAATAGVLLGGDAIRNDRQWRGTWVPVASGTASQQAIRVPASEAAVIRIPAGGAMR